MDVIEKKKSFLRTFAKCTFTAMISKYICTPFETLILFYIYGEQSVIDNIVKKPFKNIYDYFSWIYKTQKLKNLLFFHGFITYVYFSEAMSLSLTYYLNQRLKLSLNNRIYNNFRDQYLFNFSTAAVSGISVNLFAQYIKKFFTKFFQIIKLPKPPVDAYHPIISLKYFIHRGLLFGTFDSLQNLLLKENKSLFMNFLLGYSVAIFAKFLVTPLDNIGRTVTKQIENNKYNGMKDCLKQLLRNKEHNSLFKGLKREIIWSITPGFFLCLNNYMLN